jgi:hypothetical protein
MNQNQTNAAQRALIYDQDGTLWRDVAETLRQRVEELLEEQAQLIAHYEAVIARLEEQLRSS